MICCHALRSIRFLLVYETRALGQRDELSLLLSTFKNLERKRGALGLH